ncbi:MAG TPA: OmpA family protein [Cyclobacteriaceae bacterium]|nr:OmpA family protein [Cyclobacteriaceae bacterium]
MIRAAVLLLLQFPVIAYAQQVKTVHLYKPIDASGFNQDVIVENPQSGAVASTTSEMAMAPSNHVLFSQAYAKAKKMDAGNGLADNGKIIYRHKLYQLKKFNEPNALLLPKGSQGVLNFTPVTFEVISLLGFATEGKATFSITLLYSDGTTTIKSGTFPDWVDGPRPIIKGMGRMKREDGPPMYDGAPENPRMYEFNISVPEVKELRGLMIRNISGGEIDQKNRVVIFAVSGYNRPPIPIDETEEPAEDPKEEAIVVETLNELEELPVEVGVHVSLNNVLFKQSTAVLLSQSYSTLDSVSSFLIKNPTIRIEVAGHTDAYGHPKANVMLSRERAVEIKKYLVKGGVAGDRIIAKGYGGAKPIAPNDTEEHRRLNRRVEFVILSK